MGKAIAYKGGATVGVGEAASLLGKSYDWFHLNLRYTAKFMKECPDKTPKSHQSTYDYNDIMRFRRLSDWGI